MIRKDTPMLKIIRISFVGLAFVFMNALPVMAQDCKHWVNKAMFYWQVVKLEEVKFCLDIGSDVNARDDGGRTPLYLAGWSQYPEVINTLLDAGADMNVRTNDGNTPLHQAAWNENSDITIALLNAGVDVNARADDGNTPLAIAALFNANPKVFTALLGAGADVNSRNTLGSTPLHSAAWFDKSISSGKKNYEVIIVLLNAGANVNARNNSGFTPLHRAVRTTNLNTVTALLNAGADVNAQTEPKLTGFMAWFIDAWIYDKHKVSGSTTPLHEAAKWSENPEVIIALLNAGADGKVKNDNGKTAFDIAKENEYLKDTKAYWALQDARF